MSPDVESPLTVDLRARVHPHWLGSTTVGLLLLGTVLTLVAVALLVWPHRSRQVVYVVPPAEVPQVAARLGVAVPGAESESASARSTGLSLAPGLYGAPTGQEALTEVRANGVDSRLGGASVGNAGLQLRAVIARIPYARVEGHPGGSGGDAGQPTPVNPEEEGAGESDDYQLDTVPMTDRARGEGEAEPVAQAAAVDAVDPESGSGAGPDAASDDVEDLPEGGSESSEDAAAADGEADSEGAGSAEGDAVSSEEVVPELAQWEWPPIVQQSTAAPDPVPVRS